jgi:hypothetical protein
MRKHSSGRRPRAEEHRGYEEAILLLEQKINEPSAIDK